MFYYLLPTLVSYDFVLVLAAVIPAILLMVKVYRSDRLEKEPPSMLWTLTKAGIFSSLIALVVERVLGRLLDLAIPSESVWYGVILYFVVVACTEEICKYLMLKRYTWRSAEFDCQYDGVVYAVFVSLGFALWENISYVLSYGLTTAIVRAMTAIPGHACFGVFMGVFYGLAKKYEYGRKPAATASCRLLAVLVPAVLHGVYDYIASADVSTWFFVGFIGILFVCSYFLVSKASKNDRYI